MSNKTLEEFFAEHNLSKKLAKKIIQNMYDQQESKMVFNVTQIDFKFTKSKVTFSYYVADREYPDVTLSFYDFEKLLTTFLME